MITQLKYFHDSLNIVVTLAPGREIFSAKCAQFSLTFKEYFSSDEHFSFTTDIILFWNKPYQEINFKSHWDTITLRLLSDLHKSHLIFRCQLKKSLKYFSILRPKQIDFRNMSHGKMSDFVSFPSSVLTAVIKPRCF